MDLRKKQIATTTQGTIDAWVVEWNGRFYGISEENVDYTLFSCKPDGTDYWSVPAPFITLWESGTNYHPSAYRRVRVIWDTESGIPHFLIGGAWHNVIDRKGQFRFVEYEFTGDGVWLHVFPIQPASGVIFLELDFEVVESYAEDRVYLFYRHTDNNSEVWLKTAYFDLPYNREDYKPNFPNVPAFTYLDTLQLPKTFLDQPDAGFCRFYVETKDEKLHYLYVRCDQNTFWYSLIYLNTDMNGLYPNRIEIMAENNDVLWRTNEFRMVIGDEIQNSPQFVYVSSTCEELQRYTREHQRSVLRTARFTTGVTQLDVIVQREIGDEGGFHWVDDMMHLSGDGVYTSWAEAVSAEGVGAGMSSLYISRVDLDGLNYEETLIGYFGTTTAYFVKGAGGVFAISQEKPRDFYADGKIYLIYPAPQLGHMLRVYDDYNWERGIQMVKTFDPDGDVKFRRQYLAYYPEMPHSNLYAWTYDKGYAGFIEGVTTTGDYDFQFFSYEQDMDNFVQGFPFGSPYSAQYGHAVGVKCDNRYVALRRTASEDSPNIEACLIADDGAILYNNLFDTGYPVKSVHAFADGATIHLAWVAEDEPNAQNLYTGTITLTDPTLSPLSNINKRTAFIASDNISIGHVCVAKGVVRLAYVFETVHDGGSGYKLVCSSADTDGTDYQSLDLHVSPVAEKLEDIKVAVVDGKVCYAYIGSYIEYLDEMEITHRRYLTATSLTTGENFFATVRREFVTKVDRVTGTNVPKVFRVFSLYGNVYALFNVVGENWNYEGYPVSPDQTVDGIYIARLDVTGSKCAIHKLVPNEYYNSSYLFSIAPILTDVSFGFVYSAYLKAVELDLGTPTPSFSLVYPPHNHMLWARYPLYYYQQEEWRRTT